MKNKAAFRAVQPIALILRSALLRYLIDVQSLHGVLDQLNVDLCFLRLELLVWYELSLCLKI